MESVSLLSTSSKITLNVFFSRLNLSKLLKMISVDLDVADHLLMRLLHSSDTGEKMGGQRDGTSAIRRFQQENL
jgi:hypothetical protein